MKRTIRELFDKEWIRVGLLLTALVAVFFGNVVFGSSTFLTSTLTFLPNTMPNGAYGYAGHRVVYQPTRDMGASAFQTEPMNRLAARMVKSGQIPLWNPYAGTGVPLAANLQSGVFFPLSALTYLAPDEWWVQVSDALTLFGFFMAGYFTFLFLKRVGLETPAAVGSAVAYMFCGNLVLSIGTADWRVCILVPLLLYSVERLHGSRQVSSVLLVAVSIFLSVTAGMPETALFSIVLAAFYFAYRELAQWLETGRVLRSLIEGLAALAVSAGLGVALSAFLVMPFVEYLKLSWNSHPAGVGLESIPVEGAISILVPYFFGGVFPTWHNPYPPQLWGTVPYVGAVVGVLALLSLATGRNLRGMSLFWAGAALVFLLKAFGSPILQWIGNLPLLDVSIFPRFAVAPFMFSAAVLAGIGIDNIYLNRVSLRHALAASAVILFVFGGFAIYYWPLAVSSNSVRFIGVQLAAESLLILVACGALFLSYRKFVGPHAAAGLMVALVALDLFAASPKDRSDKYDPFTTPPFGSFLLQDKEPFRVLGVDSILYPDTSGVYGLADIKDLDALYPSRLTKFLQTFVDPTVTDRFIGQDVLQNKFLDLMGVKYFLSKYPLLDRWTSTDLTSQIAAQCATPPDCAGYHLDQQGQAPILRVGGDQSGWSSRIDVPIQLPQSRLVLRFDLGLEANARSEGSPQLTYRVVFDDSKGEHQVFSKPFTANDTAGLTWDGQAVDLTQFAGDAGHLSFLALCSSSCSQVQGTWKNIELIQPAQDYAGTIGLAASAFTPMERDLRAAQDRLIWVYDEEVKIYENDSAFPRAFVVHDVLLANSGDEALQKMSDAGFDPSWQVVVEGAAANETVNTSSQPANDFSATKITAEEPGSVELQVTMDQPGFLVLTDTAYPGWHAIVDGREAKDYTADYLFQAVFLGSGSHQVEFVYDPWSFRIGFVISLIALGIGISSYIISRWAESRRTLAEHQH